MGHSPFLISFIILTAMDVALTDITCNPFLSSEKIIPNELTDNRRGAFRPEHMVLY